MPEGPPGKLEWPPRKEDLERLYLVDRLSAMKIANAHGLRYKNPKVAESTVLYHLKKNGIKRRDAAEHVRKVTEAMVDEWVTRYQAGESLRKIAGGELSPVSVFLHLRKRGIGLRDKVEAQIQAVTKYERRPFLGDNVEKAYLMGLRYGDLHAVKHGRAIRVRVSTTHPAMANLFETLFSPYGHVLRYPRKAALTGYEWSLECDLDSSFTFLLEKLSVAKFGRLPAAQFLAFLAGIIDAEGSIFLHRKTNESAFELSITNTDLPLLRSLARRVRGLGFHPYIENRAQDQARLGHQNEGEISVLRLYRQAEVCNLLQVLHLRHGEKSEKSSFAIQKTSDSPFGIDADDEADWKTLTARIRGECAAFVDEARLGLIRSSRNSINEFGESVFKS